jgi:two-component system LytT family sensor kinase
MVVSAMWLVPAAFASLDQMAQRRLHGEPPATASELLFAGGDWLIYAFLTPIIFWIAGRWPITRAHLVRRTALHLAISLLFCVAWALGGTVLRLTLGYIFDRPHIHALDARFWRQLETDTLSWIFITLPFGVVVYLGMAGMAHAIRYFAEARDRELQLARISEQLAGARLSALQARVNPHFLFNTLNTIAVRARDGDSAGTVSMVEQLSDLLRRTLDRSHGAEVRLEAELDLVRDYLAIEQARFSDRLQASFRIEASVMAAAVPGFSVQHLVENAVRHGIAKRSDAGSVSVAAWRERDQVIVTVEDDGPGIDEAAEPRPGHGIEHTRERLRALYGTRGTLNVERASPTGTVAILRIPFRELSNEDQHAG